MDVEGDALLLILAHDLMEDLAMCVQLAFLLVYELPREEALWSTCAIVLSSLIRQRLSNKSPFALEKQLRKASSFECLDQLILLEEGLVDEGVEVLAQEPSVRLLGDLTDDARQLGGAGFLITRKHVLDLGLRSLIVDDLSDGGDLVEDEANAFPVRFWIRFPWALLRRSGEERGMVSRHGSVHHPRVARGIRIS